MNEELKDKIEKVILPCIESKSAELIELNVKRRGKKIAVEMTADKPEGGITLDECADLNRFLTQEIEEKHIIEEDYVIEVSSPGLDRPLKTYKDFLRVVGRSVRFHLMEPVKDKREYTGVVREVEENEVIIDSVKKGHFSNGVDSKCESIAIPLGKIQKAVQIIKE